MKRAAATVIHLAERAGETLAITELSPADGKFIGKHINHDGSITQYPTVTWWHQAVATVPVTIPALFAHLREARQRNVCLIRGASANIERKRTRRQNAHEIKYGKDRGDHGFVDAPTRMFVLDLDGVVMTWRADPEAAVRKIVAQLGEPYASASCIWFFSATHGLELDASKRWTGKISDGKVRMRLIFIADRPLFSNEAIALTNMIAARSPHLELDPAISRVVQPNYIKRPLWVEHPDRDVLGGITTIGRIKGAHEILAVPDDLAHQARWAKAQGHSADIAEHPDAEAAVRGIGGDGKVRRHLMSAVVHLLIANPIPDVVSFADHGIAVIRKLQTVVEQHRDEIIGNLAAHHRHWGDVAKYLPDDMIDWAEWLFNHPSALRRKTIKLDKEERQTTDSAAEKEAIFERVARTVEFARTGEASPWLRMTDPEAPLQVLLVAPTGSHKSTEARAAAVRYVMEHPDKTVVILMPRHKLGDEQIVDFAREHPDNNFSLAVWRGRHADDDDDDDHDTKLKMCRRSEEAKELERSVIDVSTHLCKQGRGKKAVKCPFFDVCGYQRQKLTEANIWFGAHELMTHAMPKAFGDVGLVIIDESPIDAFMFGVDINDQMTLELDTLRSFPLPQSLNGRIDGDDLKKGREALHRVLDKLRTAIDRHKGIPVTSESLSKFIGKTLRGARARRWRKKHDIHSGGRRLHYGDNATGPIHFMSQLDPKRMRKHEWRGKVEADITPDMTEKQVREALATVTNNPTVRKLAELWGLIEELGERNETAKYGRIQVHRGGEGRIIRMVGLRPIAKGWNVRTLICDATGDVELLRAIWPGLVEPEPQGWQQMPRPASVQISQVVDRSISKYAVAVEGKNDKELARKIAAARRMYAALLTKAMEYGGAPVAAIVYKSTEDWIRKHCHVPDWLTLTHWGDVTGTNKLQDVRALFVVGRPMASPEDVTRQAEALFGDYIATREYVVRRKNGRIPIVPDAKGHNVVLVDERIHPHPNGERLQRQITKAAILQAAGRARAGLRDENSPLDIHLWTDVPVPELGPVEPVLWGELDDGLDAQMLAAGGWWLECVPDAIRAYPGLFTASALKKSRRSSGTSAPVSVNAPPAPSVFPTSAIHEDGWRSGSAPWRSARSRASLGRSSSGLDRVTSRINSQPG